MSESFAVRTNGDVDGGGKIVKATASQKKVVVATERRLDRALG